MPDKNAYMRNPNKCPYCGDENLNQGELEAGYGENDHEARAIVTCLSCGEEWDDVYTFSGAIFEGDAVDNV